MSRIEAKKAFGIVTALGTKLGERARTTPGIDAALRDAPDLDAFRAVVRQYAEGAVPLAVLAAFLNEVLDEAEWRLWRSRLILQLKMVRDGGKPAPGHEKGRGVGPP